MRYCHFIALALLCFVLFTADLHAQKKAAAKTAKCELTIDKAPKLRGFYLGQTYKEFEESIPDYRPPQNMLVDDLRIIHSTSLYNFDELQSYERFENTQFTWQFYDDKLFRIFVTYIDFRPPSLSDFLRQFSETSRVPVASFRRTSPYEAIAMCSGFSAEVATARLFRAGWNKESVVVLEDLAVARELDRLEREAERERKATEQREKAERLKRERTFKP